LDLDLFATRKKGCERSFGLELAMAQNEIRIRPSGWQQPPMPGASALDRVERQRPSLERRDERRQVPGEGSQLRAHPGMSHLVWSERTNLFHG
jgi:hypothetical protein